MSAIIKSLSRPIVHPVDAANFTGTAPQVGCNVRLMVFNETGQRGDPAETVRSGSMTMAQKGS